MELLRISLYVHLQIDIRCIGVIRRVHDVYPIKTRLCHLCGILQAAYAAIPFVMFGSAGGIIVGNASIAITLVYIGLFSNSKKTFNKMIEEEKEQKIEEQRIAKEKKSEPINIAARYLRLLKR